MLTSVNTARRLARMEKQRFGDILRQARQDKGLSLRQLAEQSGIDYSRLAKIEAGSRPAPDLTAMRTLAEVLELDLASLIVSAGTSREVVENLVWSERVALGAKDPAGAAYSPEELDDLGRHCFVVPVLSRQGGVCRVALGGDQLSVFSFSEGARLRLEIPPEVVIVFLDDPARPLGNSENVLRVQVLKARRVGPILDLVLLGQGYELNAKLGRERIESVDFAEGMDVYAFVPPAAIRTSPMNEQEGYA